MVGNDQIGGARFIYMSQINLGGKGYTTGLGQNYTQNGPTYNRYANEGITWEVGAKFNVGMDVQLFRSLNFTVEYFRENRKNIFQQQATIPNYLGTATTAVYGNLAKMKIRELIYLWGMIRSWARTFSSISKEHSRMPIMKLLPAMNPLRFLFSRE